MAVFKKEKKELIQMVKKLIRVLCIAFGAALILNGVFMVIFANSTIGSYMTVILGLLFFLPGVFIKQFKRLVNCPIGKMLTAAAILLGGVFILSTVFLYAYGNMNTVNYNEDYVIVLGCGVHGTLPTEPLRSRLDTTLEYLNRNEDCKIIVSGGQGPNEDISEAEAMRLYLENAGVSPERIITEDKSTSTFENFKYSNKVLNSSLSSYSVAFITNDFHIYRANSLAKLLGFSFSHLAAPTSWYNIFPSYLREYLAISKMYILGQ